MLYNNSVKDFQTFSEIFGTPKRRYNKVLLSFWKHQKKKEGDFRATRITRMQDLYNLIINVLINNDPRATNGNNKTDHYICSFRVLDYSFKSRVYCVVGKGLPSNSDENCILCRNLKTGKNYNVRAGKFLRELIKDHGMNLDEATITFCSEEFQRLWKAFAHGYMSGLELHVDKHFDYIYTQDYLAGNFGSCMVNKGQWSFYRDYVNASAAYLTNPENKIVARCIIFHEVTDTEGNEYNYAERQYALDGDEFLKQVLVNKLIEGGYIDIYKAVGAGCRCIDNVVNKSGKLINNKKLSIKCNVQLGNTTAFMDSFVFYNSAEGVARNYRDSSSYDFNLGHTHTPLGENHRP